MKNKKEFISSNRRNNFVALLLVLAIAAIGWIAIPTAQMQESNDSNIVPITEDLAQAEMKRQLMSAREGTVEVDTTEREISPNVANAIRALPGCTTNTLPANDDGSTAAIPLPFSANFFGVTRTSTFVNNNGNITFNAPLGTFTPFPLTSTNTPIIAPFFADVDTRGAGSGLVQYGNTTLNGRTAFCVNWVNVGYFASRTNRLNSFQLILIDRSDTGAGNFDIEFNYNQIMWETGDASGGTGGLGGSSARAGYANGTTAPGTFFEFPGSAVRGGLLDTNLTTGLTNNSLNSGGVLGRYIFNARNGGVITPTPTPTASPTATPTATPTASPTATPTPTPGGGGTCTPTTTVTEGDLFPGGIASFGITSGPGRVTVDHVNAGTGLRSLTVVGTATNATVMIPAFTPGTFDPVNVTFTTTNTNLPVDFTLRAASTFHALFIRVRCVATTCVPTTTVLEGDLAPGGIISFGVTTGTSSVTVDHVDTGTGLRSLTVVGTPTNATVNIPAFTPGTFAPVTVTFTITDPNLPVSFRLRAASTFHAAFIDVRCGTPPPAKPEVLLLAPPVPNVKDSK